MSKSVTMQNVADYAQVSIATVSRIINNPEAVRESTKKKVLQAMNDLGFIQNPIKLSDSPSHTILIVVGSINNQFDTDLASSIVTTAEKLGYNTIMIHSFSYTTMEAFEKLFKDTSIAGIIFETGQVSPELIEELQYRYPVVMCSDYKENMDISYVSIDDISAAKNATNYLISTGHTKIALVNCNPDYRYSKHRERGFLQALEEAELSINKNWILRLSTINYFLVHTYIRQLLEQKNRPDAIFACCDIYGMAAINAARQLNIRVPEELSIIGFDNTSTSSMSNPSLTTVAQPIAQIGAQACELLVEKIRTKNLKNQQIILDTELIIRNSTCPKNI